MLCVRALRHWQLALQRGHSGACDGQCCQCHSSASGTLPTVCCQWQCQQWQWQAVQGLTASRGVQCKFINASGCLLLHHDDRTATVTLAVTTQGSGLAAGAAAGRPLPLPLPVGRCVRTTATLGDASDTTGCFHALASESPLTATCRPLAPLALAAVAMTLPPPLPPRLGPSPAPAVTVPPLRLVGGGSLLSVGSTRGAGSAALAVPVPGPVAPARGVPP